VTGVGRDRDLANRSPTSAGLEQLAPQRYPRSFTCASMHTANTSLRGLAASRKSAVAERALKSMGTQSKEVGVWFNFQEPKNWGPLRRLRSVRSVVSRFHLGTVAADNPAYSASVCIPPCYRLLQAICTGVVRVTCYQNCADLRGRPH
jgi:hypothetical protein